MLGMILGEQLLTIAWTKVQFPVVMPLALCFNEHIWQCIWKLANDHVFVAATVKAVIPFFVIIENTFVFTGQVWNMYNYWISNSKVTSISSLALHTKIQRVFFACFLSHFTRTTHPNSVILMVIRNSLEACTTICYLFNSSCMTSSLVVSGASGIVWPESRNIT